ncbi:MAG: hypothetical protein AAB276_05020 [Pseudomonadota bacterium]
MTEPNRISFDGAEITSLGMQVGASANSPINNFMSMGAFVSPTVEAAAPNVTSLKPSGPGMGN